MARIWIIFAIISLVFFIIAIRLFHWQILAGEQLRSVAAAQYAIEFTLPAQRGKILAQDGSPLTLNQPAYLVYGQPKKIDQVLVTSKLLAPYLRIDEATIAARLSEPDQVWVSLAHKVDTAVVDQIKNLHIKGIDFEKEPKRYYPEASMSAHVLGFVGLDQNGRDKGYFGLEGFYDRELRGKDGVMQIDKDVRGAPILIGDARRIEAEDGRDLVLWLDRTLQYIVEKRLSEGLEKYGAKEGSVVMMDPNTGGIVAMAGTPSYDPGNYLRYETSLYKNPTVASSYEPGSTFKTIIMAAGINEHVIEPSTIIEEKGPVQVGEYAIRTWNNQYRGTTTMTEVLEHSSNVGMVHVAQKLGKERMLRYMRSFGIGESTGVDLEEETSPDIRVDKEWRDIDVATASFGQGIAVTPLQMVKAVATIANGGKLLTPHMVKEIRDSRGKIVSIPPQITRQVISEKTAKLMTEMMVTAVDLGEAKWAKPKGYSIAGKTGTAQIPVAGHYDDKKTIASFVGFFPADKPRLTMLVTLREPSSSQWGSETAAPLFFSIAKDAVAYLGIPPTTRE